MDVKSFIGLVLLVFIRITYSLTLHLNAKYSAEQLSGHKL